MTTKRYDNKNRILRTGEYQRPDGRYEYKYIDADGKRKSIYSWKLTRADRLPAGKPDCECLRDMEAIIRKNLEDGIKNTGKTLDDFFNEFDNMNRYRVSDATRNSYRRFYRNYAQKALGNRKVSALTQADIVRLYLQLLDNGTLCRASLKALNNVLRQTFELAVEEKYITGNPCDRALKKIGYEKPDQRYAVTKDEWNKLVEFMQQSKVHAYWLPIFETFAQTGLRASELCGLTWRDVDFDGNVIHVNQTLRYTQNENDKYYFHIEPPKSQAGFRTIPMTKRVKDIMQDIKKQQDKNADALNEISVDGVRGFVFLNQKGHLYNSNLLTRGLYRIVSDFNYQEMENAKMENREAILLPKISCHNLRHTFISWMVESDANIKAIQSIAGHSNIGVTMDIYAAVSEEKKKRSMELLDSSLGLS